MNIALYALRNLRRQPGRNVLKVMGLAATAGTMLIWGSLTSGFNQLLEQAATSLELGDLQLHAPSYLAAPDIYNDMQTDALSPSLLAKLGLSMSPRLYAYGLAASYELSQGVTIRGIEPELEIQVTRLDQHLAEGQFLDSKAQREVLVGRDLARQLRLKSQSELILVAQARDGSLANEIFRVRGVLKSINSEADNRAVVMLASDFREFFLMPHGVHEIALRRLDQRQPLAAALSSVNSLGLPLVTQTWRDLRPMLARMLDLLSVTTYFTLSLTYVALGILMLNMSFMTVNDRMREYGIMKALGTPPTQQAGLVVCEVLWLAFFAALAALAWAWPLASYWATQGLDFTDVIGRFAFAGMNLEPKLYPHIGMRQIAVPIASMLVFMPLFAFYPAWEMARLRPLQALGAP